MILSGREAIRILSLPALDYTELSPAIRRGRNWCDRLRGEPRVEKIANCPNAIRNAERHRGRAAQRLMYEAEIVVSDIQADRYWLNQATHKSKTRTSLIGFLSAGRLAQRVHIVTRGAVTKV